VSRGERWILLGPNGSGKTSMMRIASLYLHPTSGRVRVLGEELGRTDVRILRRRVGVASAGLADQLRPGLTATEVVMTAKYAALEPWWHEYDDADRGRAVELLERSGVGSLASRPFGTFSSGERQRVLLARTLMTAPELLLLDEPTAGLDMAGREELVATLDDLARDPSTPPTVLVTHHVEEIPAGFTHALLLRDGRVLAQGPIDTVVVGVHLSACFGMELDVEHAADGRWSARLRRA
jgi:iron complex transport system ATP-binding protein